MSTQEPEQRDTGPWYKQFWAWFVLAPLLVVMVVWIPFLTIIVKDADDEVIDNYYKEGRMINQRFDQDLQAQQMGLKGELLLDLEVGEVILVLSSSDASQALPQQLSLHLDHPVEADNDIELVLQHTHAGQYRAELERRISHRWYVRLQPVVEAGENPWRLIGEIDLSQGQRLSFGGDE